MATAATVTPSSPNHLGFFALRRINQEARRLIGRFGLTEQDLEDISQDLILRVLKEVRRHNPARASCDTLIDRVVSHCATDLVRYHGAELRNRQGRTRSLDAAIAADPVGAARFADPASDLAVRQSDARTDVATLLRGLSDADRTVAETLRTSTVTEAANLLGVTRFHIYEALQRIRAQAVAIGLEPGA